MAPLRSCRLPCSHCPYTLTCHRPLLSVSSLLLSPPPLPHSPTSRSLIVATASQSADVALDKAVQDVEVYRRAQAFRAGA